MVITHSFSIQPIIKKMVFLLPLSSDARVLLDPFCQDYIGDLHSITSLVAVPKSTSSSGPLASLVYSSCNSEHNFSFCFYQIIMKSSQFDVYHIRI